MKIVRVDCHVLVVPDFDAAACSSAQDNLVVEVHTDEGLIGVGETDTNPWVARECIRARGTHCMGFGLQEMLIGTDPLPVEAVWQKLYAGSKMTGRRGALICALGAIDMALWDIRGQALGVPVYQLLGSPASEKGDCPSKFKGTVPFFGRTSITPYASLLPQGKTLAEYRDSLLDKVRRARALGFRAAKLEVCITGPYRHNGLQEEDEEVVNLVAACREAVGPKMVLMVDVAYAWSDAKQALRVLRLLEPYDLYFVETPLDIDDLDGYAYLHAFSPIRIAAGEWQNTHFEFEDLADRGQVDVLQPDVGRVGGFTEARQVCQLAAARGRVIVPHCWKSAIGIAASTHLAAASPVCPYIEFLPAELSESPIRKSLVANEPAVVDGILPLPTRPGLGVELNRDALERYCVR